MVRIGEGLSLIFDEPEKERELLTPELKAWYREEIEIPNPLASYYQELGQGYFPPERKVRFFAMQCEFCKGVHSGMCPAVEEVTRYENGAVKRVVFRKEYDDSGVITFEDVFRNDDEDGAVLS